MVIHFNFVILTNILPSRAKIQGGGEVKRSQYLFRNTVQSTISAKSNKV